MNSSHAILSSFAVLVLAGCATLQVETDYDPEVSVTQLSTYDWVDTEAYATGVPAVDSPLLKRHILEAVEGKLGRMGYRRVTSEAPELRGDGEGGLGGIRDPKVLSDAPDFRIAYSLITEQRSRVDGSYGYGGYGYGGFGYGGFGRYGYGGPYGYSGSRYRGSFGLSLYGGRHLRPYYGSYYGYPGAGYAGRVSEYLEGTLVLDITDVRTEEVIFRGWATKSLDSNPSPKQVRKYVTEAVDEILEDFPRARSASRQFGEAR